MIIKKLLLFSAIVIFLSSCRDSRSRGCIDPTAINFESFADYDDGSCIYITTGVLDLTSKKQIVKITNMLGQETPFRRNTPLFYIYDDGTVEKRIVIE